MTLKTNANRRSKATVPCEGWHAAARAASAVTRLHRSSHTADAFRAGATLAPFHGDISLHLKTFAADLAGVAPDVHLAAAILMGGAAVLGGPDDFTALRVATALDDEDEDEDEVVDFDDDEVDEDDDEDLEDDEEFEDDDELEEPDDELDDADDEDDEDDEDEEVE